MMRKFICVALFALLLPGIADAGRPSARGAETAKSGPGADANGALELAITAFPLLASDPDQEAKGRAQVVAALARRGEFWQASEEARKIAGYRRGVAFGTIGIEAARSGQSERAELARELAEESRDAESGWQRERVTAYLCVAISEAGRFDEAFELLKTITEPDDIVRARAGFARAYVRVNEFDKANAQAADAKGGFTISTAPMQAEAFLEIALARERAEDREQAVAAARDAVASSADAGWQRIEPARQAAELLHRQGEGEEAARLLEECRLLARQIADVAEFKGMVLAGLAESFARCGQRPVAEELIAEAERMAGKLPVIFQCAPLAAAGVAWKRLGEHGRAEKAWVRAATIASEHKNPRVRGQGVIALCVAASDAGGDLPESVRSLLRQALRGDA